VRLWGSAAFIAANLAAGYAGAYMQPSGYIWLMVAALVVTAAASLALRPLQPGGAAEPQPVQRRRAWSPPSRGFLLTGAATSLIQASHAVYYGFSTLDWTAKGFGGTAIGALWGLGVVAEIVLFAFSARLPAAVSPRVLMMTGAVGAVVRWGAMALDPPTELIPVLQGLHGLSFGATYLGSVQFLARTAPAGAAATVQADLSTMNGLAMAAASGLSGLVYERFGDAAYAAMALCAALGGAVLLLTPRRRD
jgi:PPP family 3-phenylpropionic acid transporter